MVTTRSRVLVAITVLLSSTAYMGSCQQDSTQSSSSSPSSSSDNGLSPQASPTWLPDFPKPADIISSYPSGNGPEITDTLSKQTLNLSAYPEPWGKPTTDHPEIQKVIQAIDWSKVPNATIHTPKGNGDLDMSGYDSNTDPYCWWSATNCVKPKTNDLPEDIYYCPRVGDWGLTYDDGPFNPTDDNATSSWSEPNLYNFLAKHNQTATLFYIGSNVVTYPAAAQRALNNGHVICIHTWSHPQMTAQTNELVVAELYWSLRAVKEAVNVTPKCWRPPYGDVDDRVRAIAWQMGMRTVLWDEDTNDWNMPGDGGGNLSPDTVDGYFNGWIEARKNGSDNQQGHIILEHELNNSTVSMAEKWLPQLQETFNVVTVHECMNITQPYWETSFVYPTEADPHPSTNSSSNNSSSSPSSGSGSNSGSSEQPGSTASTISLTFTTWMALATPILLFSYYL
ncbi:glycoside hydrolase/deacetylase [Lichtheimia hyalospora FSU 10163]|nr:glycoside hydrolase/deacetylase [Lichtheimia hyalospora FSU 10163]